MESYSNPLHSLVQSSQLSNYSSIIGAVSFSYARFPTSSNSSFRQHESVPQTTYVPSSKWIYDRGKSRPLSGPISFDFIGLPKRGVPLRELCVRGPYAMQRMMQGANDLVLANIQAKRITLHIRWPGYEHVEWVRSIDVLTPHGLMTRSQLAGIISQNFGRYVEKTQYEATRNMKWRLGPGGVRFEQIILISLYNVFEDTWQAEVAVDFR